VTGGDGRCPRESEMVMPETTQHHADRCGPSPGAKDCARDSAKAQTAHGRWRGDRDSGRGEILGQLAQLVLRCSGFHTRGCRFSPSLAWKVQNEEISKHIIRGRDRELRNVTLGLRAKRSRARTITVITAALRHGCTYSRGLFPWVQLCISPRMRGDET